ncbi:hypothetical protein [Flavipsychrobacter stenotrophus]|uniref:hypothetical protein n=1 Tax=Flavipsychrobacter stenotrophus TaxID=2077091 RepID=UPI001374FDC6|nr:hypothetical protein [Flavipsychrobacter stenotrophus]
MMTTGVYAGSIYATSGGTYYGAIQKPSPWHNHISLLSFPSREALNGVDDTLQ